MLRAKIHRLTVTATELHYVGSLTLDRDLLDAAGLLPFEHVHFVNLSTGGRAETYLIEGERGLGDACLNGAAARLAEPGDLIIVMAFAAFDERELCDYEPILLECDPMNRPRRMLPTERFGTRFDDPELAR